MDVVINVNQNNGKTSNERMKNSRQKTRERERQWEREREECKESSITCLMQYHLIKQVILLFAHIAALCTGRFACQ